MSAESKPSHDELLRQAAHKMAPLANALHKLLGHDAGLLLLAAASQVLELSMGRAGVAEHLRNLAIQYEDGGHFDAAMN